MKRIISLLSASAVSAVLFTGCGDHDSQSRGYKTYPEDDTPSASDDAEITSAGISAEDDASPVSGDDAFVRKEDDTPLVIGDDVDIYSTDISEIPGEAFYKAKITSYAYDEAGNVTETAEGYSYFDKYNNYLMGYYTKNGETIFGGRRCNTYDEEGNLTARSELVCFWESETDRFYALREYEYGKNEIMTAFRYYGKDRVLKTEMTSVVDDEGRPVSTVVISYNDDGTKTFDSPTEYSEPDEYGNYTLSVQNDDQFTYTHRYEYNSDGKPTREENITDYNDYDAKVIYIAETQYDDMGNVIKRHTFSGTDYNGDGRYEGEYDNTTEHDEVYVYGSDGLSYTVSRYKNNVLETVEVFEYERL